MPSSRRTLAASLLTAICLTAAFAPSAVAAAPPSLLFSHEAANGTAAPVSGKPGEWNITLRGVPGRALAFEDRPGRLSAPVPMTTMLRSSFTAGGVPPNASLSLTTRPGKRPVLLAVELLNGRYDGKRDTVRYRVRKLASAGKAVQIPRRFSAAAVFIDDAGSARSCTVHLSGGRSFDQNAPNLQLTGQDKSSHNSWTPAPPQQLSGWSATSGPFNDDPGGFFAVTWGTFQGILTFRGCTNTAIYGDQYGSVTVNSSDPWSGSNSYSCTTTGSYVCFGPSPGFNSHLGGDSLEVYYAVCATNDQACLGEFGS
ncbi:MAG: hypothetical protein JHC84_13865 [Solirubrobacteraceae bacterium]|nr:hypothetical protein [Solirubrobacteraceae bacterium]